MRVKPSPVILMYHDVRDPKLTNYPRRYEGTSFLTPAEFAQQIDYVAQNYQVISLEDAARCLSERRPIGRAAVLTFDDGLADHFDEVRPLLLAKGLPATFFIPTAAVFEQAIIPSNKIQFVLAAMADMREVVDATLREIEESREEFPELPTVKCLWDQFSVSLWPNNTWSPEEVFITRLLRSGLEPKVLRNRILDRLFERFVTDDERTFSQNFYLSPDQMTTLCRDGFEIGGHGHASVPLTSLDAGEIAEDLTSNIAILRRALSGINDNTRFAISFPNGAVDTLVTDAAKAAGFAIGLTTEPSAVSASHTAMRLPRFNAPAYFPPKGII